jgi:hypothetical protein
MPRSGIYPARGTEVGLIMDKYNKAALRCNRKSVSASGQLDLFDWAAASRSSPPYHVRKLAQRFGVSDAKANLFAELAGINGGVN